MKLRNETININNTKINYIVKNNEIYLSKKEIINLFGINKSDLNKALKDIKIQNTDFYNKNKSKFIHRKTNKVKKYFSINILISLGYRFKLYSGVKLLININRNMKNTNGQTRLTSFKNIISNFSILKNFSF